MGFAKEAAFLAGLVRAKLTGRPAPLTAIVNVTDRCNLRCAYCYASYPSRGKEEMTTEQLREALSELKAMGCRRVSISGGDPLLREDLGEVLEHIRGLGMLCTVNSNGVLVPDRIDILRLADTLCLSLDGDREAHDAYRGQGSHQAVMNALDAARGLGLQLLTNTVLHRRNLGEIEYILATARQKGFRCLFNVAIDRRSRSGPVAFKAEEVRLRDTLTALIGLKRRGAPILTSAAALAYCRDWPDYADECIAGRRPAFRHVPCQAGRYFLTLDTNGEVFPCTHLMNGSFRPENACHVGMRQAVRQAGDHRCTACYHVGHAEFNMLFALRPASLLSMGAARLRSLFA